MSQIGENIICFIKTYSDFVNRKRCYYKKNIYKSTVYFINIPAKNDIFQG